MGDLYRKFYLAKLVIGKGVVGYKIESVLIAFKSGLYNKLFYSVVHKCSYAYLFGNIRKFNLF